MYSIIIVFITAVLSMFVSLNFSKQHVKSVSILGIVIALLVNIFGFNFQFSLYKDFFFISTLNTFFINISSFIVLCILLFVDTREKNTISKDFFSLILFSLCGSFLLFGISNLLTFFLSIEIMSLPLYVLASSNKDSSFSLEAGLKYYIMGAFSTAIMLFGIALFYGYFNSFDFQTIMQIFSQTNSHTPAFVLVGILLIVVSLLFKLSLAPFHFWTPEVYQGSPLLVTTYMATIVKISSAVALLYLFSGFFILYTTQLMILFSFVIIISSVIGNILAYRQKNIKKILAYSSIVHSSFILMTIMQYIYTQNLFAFNYYLLSYSLASLGILLTLSTLENFETKEINDLEGLFYSEPLKAIFFILMIISLAGIPLSMGFVAKLNIISIMYNANNLLFIVAIISSMLSIGYYLRFVSNIFSKPEINIVKKTIKMNLSTIIIGLISILSIVLALFPVFFITILSSNIKL